MVVPSSHAVRAGPDIGGDERSERRCAFDEPGEPAVVNARAPVSHVLEEAPDGIGERRSAPRREELADLVHRAPILHGSEDLRRLQTPDEVGHGDGVGVEGETIAWLERFTDGG
jgi:hypothetical protein